jgi:hypothetical protein
MRVRYAVTFEFGLRPPLTHCGEVSGTTLGALVGRAVRESQRVVHPQRWASLNCVLLERLDLDAETASEPAERNGEAILDDESEGAAVSL